MKSAQHRVFWESDRHVYPCLDRNLLADVLVVGGGITGLTAAMSLTLAGKKVVLIEMNRVGDGTTGHSTGHLDNHYDRGLARLESNFGTGAAERLIRAKQQAVDHIEKWVSEFSIDCDFVRVPGYLYTEDRNDSTVDAEHDAAWKIRLTPVALEVTPLPFKTYHAARFFRQARFSPLPYVTGLARTFVEQGGIICENTRMHDFEEKDGKVITNAGDHMIESEHLVLAGHASLVGKFTIQTRIYPNQSFVIAADVEDEIEDALYWDTDTPYHYTRIASSDKPKTLIIGGGDQHTGSGADMRKSFGELAEYANRRYSGVSITHYWSHEFFEPADGAPYAGRAPRMEKVYTASAFSGDGLTLGTASAILLCDLIQEKSNPIADVLSPERIKPVASVRQTSKTLGQAVKHLFYDRFAKYARSVEEVDAGTGAIVKDKGSLYAVYKDSTGEIEVLSPACRHMGCIVHWNNAEETWDCPCHGGRYDKHGNVIMGPPREPLEKKTIKVEAEASAGPE